MNRTRLSRLWAAAAGLSLIGLTAFAPIASAAPPSWHMTVEPIPATVKSGESAGFVVRIYNDGPSNIPALFLSTNLNASPTHVGTPTQGTCSAAGSGPLSCAFGSLGSGPDPVSVVVAYRTPNSGEQFQVEFLASTVGATTKDRKGTSRGDELREGGVTTLRSDPDFAGGFVIGNTSIANSTNLTAANPQSTRVDAPSAFIPATVQDGVIEDLCGAGCSRSQFGQVSEVGVANGTAFQSPFRIVMTFRGQSLPNPRPNAATLVVYHVLDDGTTVETIAERCDSAANPTIVPDEGCLVASYAGNTLQIVIWTYYNGKFRGAV